VHSSGCSRDRPPHGSGLASSEEAAIVIVGSSHASPLAQLVPSGIGARLLHDATFAAAVGAVHAFGAELEVIAVASPQAFATPR
jgi:hypothetical protein